MRLLESTGSTEWAGTRSYGEWQGLFLGELFRVHPELVDAVENLDVWLWGHAMVRPVPTRIEPAKTTPWVIGARFNEPRIATDEQLTAWLTGSVA